MGLLFFDDRCSAFDGNPVTTSPTPGPTSTIRGRLSIEYHREYTPTALRAREVYSPYSIPNLVRSHLPYGSFGSNFDGIENSCFHGK